MGTTDKHFGTEAKSRFDGPGSCLRGRPCREVYFLLLACIQRNLQRLIDRNIENGRFHLLLEVCHPTHRCNAAVSVTFMCS